MNPRYEPFTPAQCQQLRVALATQVGTVDDFARLRQLVSGDAVSLAGLRALLAREHGLAGRFFARMAPSVLRHAQTLLVKGAPSVAVHAQGEAARSVFTRAEVGAWVAHMFLGTLPSPGVLFPSLDFARLLASTRDYELAKLRCALEYFDRIAVTSPRGRVEVERVVVPARTAMEWAFDGAPLTALTVDPTGTIEDAAQHLQADFANAFVGGGVLRGGCVQEEIRFAVAPEHMIAMLVSPRMADDEAIVMRGAERFARTRGYAYELEFDGPFHDPTARLADGSVDVDFVAIDAIDYRRGDPDTQFGEEAMLRELTKCRAGLRRDARGLPFATGNWGCGAFRGSPPLKAILQWIAASAEGRSLRYCTFGDARVGDLAGFVAKAAARFKTAGALWSRVRVAARDGESGLYERVLEG